jgi:quercetin dioxygenase-like cupin family protein
MTRTAFLLAAAFLALPPRAPRNRPVPNPDPSFRGHDDHRPADRLPAASPPKVTAAIVTVPPGGETGWHLHEVPLFAYILEGEIALDYGEKGTNMLKAGDSLLEAMNWAHNGKNTGAVPLRILAVYMGAEGIDNAETAAAPH